MRLKNIYRNSSMLNPTHLLLILVMFHLQACRSNKAKIIETEISKTSAVGTDTAVGVDDGDTMILQKKLHLSEEIRRMREDTFDLEDRVYGNRKFQSTGLYGKYKSCYLKLNEDQKSQLPKPGNLDRWTDESEEIKIGYNQSKEQLIALKEDKLNDYLDKLRERKKNLQEKEDTFNDGIRRCHQ